MFIETLLNAGLVGKKERAIYKNLELLERRGYITYQNKELRFTERGYKQFLRVQSRIAPYIRHEQFWAGHAVENRLQARLKR